MRPLDIVFSPEAIQSSLLLRECRDRRPGRLVFQSFVHPLVFAVLLRMSCSNALGATAQLKPPDRESRQPADRLRTGERNSVVGPHYAGNSKLLEVTSEGDLHGNERSGTECSGPDPITTRHILNRERVTVASAREPELSFAVSSQ